MQAIHHQTDTSQTKQALYKHFAAYIHTISLDELIESIERARLDAKLRHVVIYGAACSYCLGRAERLEGSYLRTFALELKGRRAETLAAAVTFLRRVKAPTACSAVRIPPSPSHNQLDHSPFVPQVLAELALPFSEEELTSFAERRKYGLSEYSID